MKFFFKFPPNAILSLATIIYIINVIFYCYNIVITPILKKRNTNFRFTLLETRQGVGEKGSWRHIIDCDLTVSIRPGNYLEKIPGFWRDAIKGEARRVADVTIVSGNFRDCAGNFRKTQARGAIIENVCIIKTTRNTRTREFSTFAVRANVGCDMNRLTRLLRPCRR